MARPLSLLPVVRRRTTTGKQMLEIPAEYSCSLCSAEFCLSAICCRFFMGHGEVGHGDGCMEGKG